MITLDMQFDLDHCGEFELGVLTPDPQALREVIALHEQLDPPGEPLVLSSMARMTLADNETIWE